MTARQSPLPTIWLISDARNDASIEATLARLPRGSGLILRHHHLAPAERRQRFAQLRRTARRHGHRVYLSGSERLARRWGADGSYGPPSAGSGCSHLVNAHNLREIAAGRRCNARAMVISPVYPTRSHPGARGLGRLRFLLLAQRAGMPVIALGGMTQRRARGLPVHGWAAIDGLSPAVTLPAA